MAAIYIHIPFCKKKCHYCDFYKSLSLHLIPDFLSALGNELMLRSDYLSENIIETIYFGGGTPSTLSYLQINQVIELIQRRFEISNSAEITLEANPDDLSEKYVSDLTKTAVNRISLGIQSFDDADLVLMNRRHSATEAIDAVRRLQSAGFTNISGDLIYGLPGMTGEKWQKNLDTFFSLNIPHFSAYHLTYEKDTIFYNKLKSGLLKETKEAKSEEFFTLLIENAKLNDFEHYEISNFAKSGYHSRHNSAYWSDNEYLGLGPSGHSFNGKTRDWNPADIDLYIRSYREQKIITETEKISKKDLYNEFVMKRLRTSAGVKKSDLSLRFPLKYEDLFYRVARKYLQTKHLQETEDSVSLTQSGLFISDTIISEMFYV